MILKEINRRILAIIALSFFLLSTSGMVLFYHYCQHSQQMVYSVYVDSTEDICEENAEILFHSSHQHQNDCCEHKPEGKSCCEHHNSSYKTVKLKNDYNYSNRQVPPKPSILSLLINLNAPHQIDILHASLFDDGLLRELPPEIPLLQHSGKEIITFHHTFKIAC